MNVATSLPPEAKINRGPATPTVHATPDAAVVPSPDRLDVRLACNDPDKLIETGSEHPNR